MTKHWRLYESISDSQVRQLYAVGITVNIDNDFVEFDFPSYPQTRFIKAQTVNITTVSESQEVFLRLMFNNTILHHVSSEGDRLL